MNNDKEYPLWRNFILFWFVTAMFLLTFMVVGDYFFPDSQIERMLIKKANSENYSQLDVQLL